MATLHYEFRQTLSHFYQNHDATLALLLDLITRMNNRNRCYPLQQTLANDLECSTNTIKAATDKLLEMGAVRLVPYTERVADEKELSNRRTVYEITGQVIMNGQTYPVFYYSDIEAARFRKMEAMIEDLRQENEALKAQIEALSHSSVDLEMGHSSVEFNMKPAEGITINTNNKEQLEKEEKESSGSVLTEPDKDTTPTPEPVAEKTSPDGDQYLLLQEPLDRLDSLRNECKLVKEPDKRTNYKGYTKHPFYEQTKRVFMYGCAIDGQPFERWSGLGPLVRWFHNEALGKTGEPATLLELVDFMTWYHRDTSGYNMPRERSRMVHHWGRWKKATPTIQQLIEEKPVHIPVSQQYIKEYEALMEKKRKGVA